MAHSGFNSSQRVPPLFKARSASFWLLFSILVVIRCLSIIPMIIDDDEAWFAISGKTLSSPFAFYSLTPDNKPPGTVWFYSLFNGNPVCARLAFIGLTTIAALVIARMVRNRFAAILFLCCTAIPVSKLLAVTNEGLMSIAIIFCYSIFWKSLSQNQEPSSLESFLAGVFASIFLLIKQTGLFFLLPPLFVFLQFYLNHQTVKKSFILFSTSMLICVITSVILLNSQLFYFWNFTYATSVLTGVRSLLFSTSKEFISSALILGIFLWPLWFSDPFRKFFSVRNLHDPRKRFLIVWIFASVATIAIGSGLFLHYFLPLLAPVCILICAHFRDGSSEPHTPSELGQWEYKPLTPLKRRYLIGLSCLSCLFLAIPYSTTFWGTDLFYAERLAQQIDRYTSEGAHVFLWGGNAIPLVLSHRHPFEKFMTSRFATTPYATPEMENEFHSRFLNSPPELFVDLHDRGDNRFKTSPLATPWLRDILDARYRLVATSTPWVNFYQLVSPSSDSSKETPYPKGTLYNDVFLKTGVGKELSDWIRNLNPRTAVQFLTHYRDFYLWDLTLRTWMAIELTAHSIQVVQPAQSEKYRQTLIEWIHTDLVNLRKPIVDKTSRLAMLDEIRRFYLNQQIELPLPLLSRSWWVSFALKELQP